VSVTKKNGEVLQAAGKAGSPTLRLFVKTGISFTMFSPFAESSAFTIISLVHMLKYDQ